MKGFVLFQPFLGCNYQFPVRTKVVSQVVPLCTVNAVPLGKWSVKFRGGASEAFLGIQPNV